MDYLNQFLREFLELKNVALDDRSGKLVGYKEFGLEEQRTLTPTSSTMMAKLESIEPSGDLL